MFTTWLGSTYKMTGFYLSWETVSYDNGNSRNPLHIRENEPGKKRGFPCIGLVNSL